MDDQAFRDLVLQLSGPGRDHSRLAKVLGVTESTAYGWVRLADEGRLSQTASVRGDQNRVAKAALIEAGAALERGSIAASEVEAFLRERLPAVADSETAPPAVPPTDESARKASLRRGLQYVMSKFDSDMTADEVIAAVEAVVAMNKGRP
jgi:transposase-like protein